MGLHVEDLGLVPYDEAHRLQLERLEARVRGEISDTLMLLEHPPVITLGRATRPGNVHPQNPIPVVSCERGGDVTLHAPGQVVGYLIRLLEPGRRDLRAHLRLLEEILIAALGHFDLAGHRIAGRTGVWVRGRKIASIGVACRRWCTWHGFALNVEPDLELFSFINPCGFDPAVMTSVKEELPGSPGIPVTKRVLGESAHRLFEVAACVDGAIQGT